MPQKKMGPYRLKMKEDLQTVPRSIGLLNQIRFLVAGPGSIAWMICCLMLLISSCTGIKEVYREFTALHNPERTQGQVIDTYETGWEINESTECEIVFSFEVGGTRYESSSFTTGMWPAPGTPVDIEYSKSNPVVARIVGTSYSHVKYLPLSLFALALVAALVGVLRWRTSFKWGRLLVRGEVTEASLANKKRTNVTVNDQPVYALTFSFPDKVGQEHELVIKTHDTGKFLDEERELALYDPKNPQTAYLIDQLPFNLALSRPGVWAPPKSSQFVGLIIRGAILVALVMLTIASLAKPTM